MAPFVVLLANALVLPGTCEFVGSGESGGNFTQQDPFTQSLQEWPEFFATTVPQLV